MVVINHKLLTEFGAKILEAAGTPAEEAAWVSECLVLSNLKGVDSHGVQQIPGYVKAIEDGFLKPGMSPTLLEEKAATAFYDGNWGYGYTIAQDVMGDTMEKAKEAGTAFSGIRNIHHIGRVGKWVELALDEDMIGIASQPGGVYIAPWGGLDRKLPIGPIAFAAPTGKYPPMVVDMSVGPISGGRTAILAVRGQEVPLGWYIDDEGKSHGDPKLFRDGVGAQRPLGQEGLGYKGMTFSMILNVLAGPLLGHVVTQAHSFKRCGVFLGAIDIEAFVPVETFKEGIDALIDDMKSSRLAEGFEEILIPGEPEWRQLEKRRKEGLYLDDEIYQRILETAESKGVDTSRYRGRPGKLEITHPSYTLEDRYR
ncbi:MAG: Ldh family oxidoreductase [Candidatus Bathyarchaeota archaeon]|jgi:LDH2 family malate/lactate/ureidoglycolate dehydrogenase